MSRKKTLPREEFEGRTMLVINEDYGLQKIKLRLLTSYADVRNVVALYREFSDHGSKWFWVETGVKVHLKKTDDGFKWLVEDYREHSLNYKWFSSKSKRFCAKLVERINAHLSEKYELLEDENI